MNDQVTQEKNRRDPDLDQIEKTAPPLAAQRIPVTRFNRRVMILFLAVIAGVTAISLIFAFSPAKKATQHGLAALQSIQGKELAQAADSPSLPECLVSGPKSYGELKKTPYSSGYPTPVNAVPLSRAPQNADPGQSQQRQSLERTLERFPPPPLPLQQTYQQGSQLTSRQQAILAQLEERSKDALDAARSALAFEGKNSGQLSRQAPAPSPAIPGLERLENLASRVASAVTPTEAGAGPTPAGEDQNQQDEKRKFSREKRGDSRYLEASLLAPISPFEITAGSILPGTLLTGINSDLPGQIVAQLRESIFDSVTGRYLLIPQGTRLIGDYDSKIAYGQERALVVWSRLILPNGHSINLEGMPGVDLSGYAGVTGRVNNHYGKLLTGVVLGSVIGAGAQVATGGQGSANTPGSFGQLAVSGAATNLNQAGQQITQKNLNLQPTIEVSPGQKINIFVTKDMILKPYPD